MSPISHASRLAEFGSGIGTHGAIIQVDNTNKRVGIGTTNPQAMLQVGTAISMFGSTGIVSATTFTGSGANLTSLPSAQLTGALPAISGANLTGVVGVGTLNVRTETITASGVSTFTGALNATSVVSSGAVSGTTGTFSAAVSGTTGTFSAAVSGTTGTFSGAVNVDATTDSTSSTSGALIVDGGLGIAKNVYIGAGLSVAGTLTYEDVTNVDSVGLITAKSGVNVSGGQLLVGSGITMGIAGVATFSGTSDVHLLDNVKLNIGDGPDLQLSHSGTNSVIDNNTGGLYIRNNVGGDVGGDIFIQAKSGENSAIFTHDGSAALHYDNSVKFATTNDGTVTTGICTATDFSGASGGAADFPNGLSLADNKKILVGSSDDLEIYHSGSDNFITADTQNLILKTTAANKGTYIQSDDHVWITTPASAEVMAKFIKDGASELYHNNIKTFETIGAGITIYGPEGGAAQICLSSDEGDDNADKWRITKESGNNSLRIQNYTSGSWETNILATGDGAVEFYNDGSKKFETYSAGLKLNNITNTVLWPYDGNASSRSWGWQGENGSYGIFELNYSNGADLTLDETAIRANANGAVQLYHDDTIRFQTSTDGVDVTSGHLTITDNYRARFGAGLDLQIYHSPNVNHITAATNFEIKHSGLKHTFYDYTGGTKYAEINSDGISDNTHGHVRDIPATTKTSGYTLVAGDFGKVVYISTGGVTIPNSVMSGGNVVTIINNSGSDQTITQASGLTLYNTADASTGNRTLAGRGMCTLWFQGGSTAYISGAGLS